MPSLTGCSQSEASLAVAVRLKESAKLVRKFDRASPLLVYSSNSVLNQRGIYNGCSPLGCPQLPICRTGKQLRLELIASGRARSYPNIGEPPRADGIDV